MIDPTARCPEWLIDRIVKSGGSISFYRYMDLVLNDLVASAIINKHVEVLSDGTPWRPVIHIKDVCQALMAGLKAPLSLINGRSYNIGLPNGNFTVKELSEAASKAVPNS